jgi:hypothetical protein
LLFEEMMLVCCLLLACHSRRKRTRGRGGVEVEVEKKKKNRGERRNEKQLTLFEKKETGTLRVQRRSLSNPRVFYSLLPLGAAAVSFSLFFLIPSKPPPKPKMGLAAAASAPSAAKSVVLDDTAAAPSKTHEFLWTATVEPHAARRKAILAAHGDEVRKLYGYDVWTAVQVRK